MAQATILPNPAEPVTINHPIFADLIAGIQELEQRTVSLAMALGEIAKILNEAGLLAEDEESEDVEAETPEHDELDSSSPGDQYGDA